MFSFTKRMSPAFNILVVSVAVVCGALTTRTSAQTTRVWLNPNGGQYNNATNWSGFQVPSSIDNASFPLEATYSVEWTSDTTVDDMFVGEMSGLGAVNCFATNNNMPFTHTVNGDLEISNALSINNDLQWEVAGDAIFTGGHLELRLGASAIFANQLNLGFSIPGAEMSVSSGSVSAGDVTTGNGTITLNGSLLTANSIDRGSGTGFLHVLTGSNVETNWLDVWGVSINREDSQLRIVASESSESNRCSLTMNNRASLINSSGNRLVLSGDSEIRQDAVLDNGTSLLQIAAHLTISDGGCVTTGLLEINDNPFGDDGVLTLGDQGLLNAELIQTNGQVFEKLGGELRANRIEGDLNNGGGFLIPQNDANSPVATITGDFNQSTGATLCLQISDPDSGGKPDAALAIEGDAVFSGDLRVRLLDFFMPQAGDTITILTAESFSGEFANISDGQRLQTSEGNGSVVVNLVADPMSPAQIVISDFRPSVCVGDVNGDGVVNLLDIGPFIDALSTGTFVAEADVNLDGVVNLLDIDPFIVFLSGTFTEAFEVGLDGGGAIITERFGISQHVPATDQYAVLLTLREAQGNGMIVELGDQIILLSSARLIGANGPDGMAVYEACWGSLEIIANSSIEGCSQLLKRELVPIPPDQQKKGGPSYEVIWVPMEQLRCAVIEPVSG